ncbi:MAG: tripartite tricarboxylate transporter substrate binding protein [Xanthobacteraceae bacterium]|nr:tripartite tricarboxylate transporter substrate binding protein [Xanthobacteraceae bacterium]
MTRVGRFVALVSLLVLASADAHAQAWPNKPIRIVAPFAPGGAADTLGRIIADPLSAAFKQQFFVENRPGAGGMIGAAAVATAAPDGYTFVVSGVASHVIAPALSPNPGFDPVRDFTHIAYLGGPPVLWIVNPAHPAKDYKEFLAWAKANPKPIDYISPGTGTQGNLFAEGLARREGFKLVHIPHKGAGPALMDLIGGHVPFGSVTFSSAAELIRAGKVRPIAVSAEKRLANFPDIPTFKELGYDDLVTATWFGFSGPAKLPSDMVQALGAEITQTLQRPEVQKRMAQDEIETRLMTPAQFTSFLSGEVARWAPLAKSLNLQGN